MATTAAGGPGVRTGEVAGKVIAYVALLIGAVVFLFPFYYMAMGSISPAKEVGTLRLLPSRIELANWQYMLSRIPVAWNLLNSVVYAGGVILCTLVVGSLTGYALSRLSFFGRDALFNLILLTLMIPFHLTMIPLYIVVVGFGWTQPGVQNYLGLIVPGAVSATAIVIFRQFFLQLPQELFDAARIDGCSELRILRQIVIPLSTPAFLITILITFIGPWNDFLWPLLVTKDIYWMPLAVSVALFGIGGRAGGAASQWGTITAAATILAAPAVLIFLVFQRYFVQGITFTGLKD
jgi:multiple sugar transport system permease protein